MFYALSMIGTPKVLITASTLDELTRDLNHENVITATRLGILIIGTRNHIIEHTGIDPATLTPTLASVDT